MSSYSSQSSQRSSPSSNSSALSPDGSPSPSSLYLAPLNTTPTTLFEPVLESGNPMSTQMMNNLGATWNNGRADASPVAFPPVFQDSYVAGGVSPGRQKHRNRKHALSQPLPRGPQGW